MLKLIGTNLKVTVGQWIRLRLKMRFKNWLIVEHTSNRPWKNTSSFRLIDGMPQPPQTHFVLAEIPSFKIRVNIYTE